MRIGYAHLYLVGPSVQLQIKIEATVKHNDLLAKLLEHNIKAAIEAHANIVKGFDRRVVVPT